MSEELDKAVEKAAEQLWRWKTGWLPQAKPENLVRTHLAPLLTAKDAEIARLREGIEAVRGLMDESTGVYGLHRNGDGAPWSELEEEGQFEGWLAAFNKAEQALQGREKE